MRVYIEKEEKEEIPPVSKEKLKEDDKGIIRFPKNPKENPIIPDDVKELVAVDAAFLGPKATSQLHGVPVSTVHDIANNTEAGQNAKAIKAMDKHGIADMATAKLMLTLNLLSPMDIDKEKDKIAVIDGLSKVIERMADKGKDGEGKRVVHLHLYAPNQKEEREYPVIEVA